jgi:sporulation protein YlmC with PRC-barrel domain
MKTTYTGAISSLVVALALAAPQALAEQHMQGAKEQQSQQTSTGGSGMTQQDKQAGKMMVRADEIAGAKVVNRAGNDIGAVDGIVRSKDDGKHYAVISVGGFFDIGDKDIALPLDQLSMKDDKVVLPETVETQQQLEGRPGYESDQYEEIADATEVEIERAEFAAFESGGQGGMSGDQQKKEGMEHQGESGQTSKQGGGSDKGQ